MKKAVKLFATIALLSTLTACSGMRGHDGAGPICKNNTFMGISVIEWVSPCKK